jgi:hypothetical protein
MLGCSEVGVWPGLLVYVRTEDGTWLLYSFHRAFMWRMSQSVQECSGKPWRLWPYDWKKEPLLRNDLWTGIAWCVLCHPCRCCITVPDSAEAGLNTSTVALRVVRGGPSLKWESKIWSQVPRALDPRVAVLAWPGSTCTGKLQARPLVRVDAPY